MVGRVLGRTGLAVSGGDMITIIMVVRVRSSGMGMVSSGMSTSMASTASMARMGGMGKISPRCLGR